VIKSVQSNSGSGELRYKVPHLQLRSWWRGKANQSLWFRFKTKQSLFDWWWLHGFVHTKLWEECAEEFGARDVEHSESLPKRYIFWSKMHALVKNCQHGEAEFITCVDRSLTANRWVREVRDPTP